MSATGARSVRAEHVKAMQPQLLLLVDEPSPSNFGAECLEHRPHGWHSQDVEPNSYPLTHAILFGELKVRGRWRDTLRQLQVCR
jgi:hypothetical protein